MNKLSLLAGLLLLSSNAMANSNIPINPWKHCGIGAMIFNDNPTAALLSNIIWDLGTTAVSSKSSSDENCEGDRTIAAVFIQQHFNTLIEQTSQGEGEHLNAMLEILSVPHQDQVAVIASLRAEVNADTQPETYYHALIAAL